MDCKFLLGDQHVNAAVAQNVIYFIRLQKIINGHQHRAGAKNAKHSRHKFRPVFEPKSHTVTRLHTEF